jgi:hypothetical protein
MAWPTFSSNSTSSLQHMLRCESQLLSAALRLRVRQGNEGGKAPTLSRIDRDPAVILCTEIP